MLVCPVSFCFEETALALPLLLEEIPADQVPSVIADALECWGVGEPLDLLLKKTGCYNEVVGYLAECYLSDSSPASAPVLSVAHFKRLAAIVEKGRKA